MKKIENHLCASDSPMEKSMIGLIWHNKNLRFQGLTFLLLFSGALLFSSLMDIDEFRYDALYYWAVADDTLASGSFRFLDFHEVFRGYLLPVFLLGLKEIFPGVWGWRIFSALQIAIIFSVMLPVLYNRSFSAATLLRALIAELFFFYVWGNFAQYPLSDLPAIFFLMVAICICIKQRKERHPDLDGNSFPVKKIRNALWWILAGAFFYAAYNTRVIYLYAIVITIVFHIFTERKKTVFASVLCILFGMSILAIPQCMINYEHVGTFSPKVYTEQLTGYKVSLQNQQLLWGIAYPKYETHIGSADEYPSPAVFFDDPAGVAMVQRESLSVDSFSLRSVIRLCMKYPLDMIGIYTRHLISAMTPAWNEVYISNLYTNKVLLVLSSIVLWMIAGLHLFSASLRRSDVKQNAGYFVAIVTPALVQLLGAVELRFFLPAYLMLYGLVFLKISYCDLFHYIVINKWKVASILFIITILWVTIFGMILAMNREQVMLIGGY